MNIGLTKSEGYSMKINCSYDELVELHKIIPNPKNPIFKKYKIYKDGRVFSFYKNDFMKTRTRKDGYIDIKLGDKMYLVHRLVMEYFNGQSDLEVNHKDGNKTNNNLSNLEYVNRSQNIRHSIDVLGNSHSIKGFESVHSKFNNKNISKAMSMYCLGINREIVASFFGVNKETLTRNLIRWDEYSYKVISKINASKNIALLNNKRWGK